MSLTRQGRGRASSANKAEQNPIPFQIQDTNTVHLGVFHQWGLPSLMGQPTNLGLGITEGQHLTLTTCMNMSFVRSSVRIAMA